MPPRALPAAIDWPRFIALAQFHRIEGLVHRALRDADGAPAHIIERLAIAASNIAAQNLRAIAESRSIMSAFTTAAVPILFLKGQTLGMRAYGTATLKSAIDIDLLVDSRDLDRAAACLRSTGFELSAPHTSDTGLRRWHRSWKESVWMKAGIQMDLHTRLADNPQLLSKLDVHANRQTVDVGSGVALPTLADEELLAYLAVHGASSAWFRLKWIADFAALLWRSSISPEQFYSCAQALSAGRAADQALMLADDLFGGLASAPDLNRLVRRGKPTRALHRLAIRMLLRGPVEPTERFLGTIPIHLSQFRLQSGLKFKVSEIRRQAGQLLTRTSV